MFLIPLFYVLIVYWMIGLATTAGQFFTMYLIIVAISFTATSVGLFLGSFFDNPKLVAGMVPMFIRGFMPYAGFFKNYASVPAWIGWIRFLNPYYYCYTALSKN